MPTPLPLASGTYAQYPALVTLPDLVTRQRRLERRIVPLAPLLLQEKDVRQQIDALLILAGIAPGDRVTCRGYDVMHCTRAGASHLNADVLTEQLVAAGVARELIDQVIAASTETGDAPFWATVKPSKGATVRLPPLEKKRMAKAGRHRS